VLSAPNSRSRPGSGIGEGALQRCSTGPLLPQFTRGASSMSAGGSTLTGFGRCERNGSAGRRVRVRPVDPESRRMQQGGRLCRAARTVPTQQDSQEMFVPPIRTWSRNPRAVRAVHGIERAAAASELAKAALPARQRRLTVACGRATASTDRPAPYRAWRAALAAGHSAHRDRRFR
jgi:hypothetical protein